MRDADLPAFTALLDGVCALLSRGAYTPNATNTALWFRALAAHDIAAVRAAFDAHVRDPQRGRFVPTPADVIAQLLGFSEADGRPGAEEAWAFALKARDEEETVVWTAEVAEAWGVCKPVMDVGDEVGARMAFREAYLRIVEAARRASSPATWTASLGHDPQRRDAAIRVAVEQRRLPASELPALPAPEQPLLEVAAPTMPPEVREKLNALAAKLKATAPSDAAEPSPDLLDKRRTMELAAESNRRVEAYLRERGLTTETEA